MIGSMSWSSRPIAVLAHVHGEQADKKAQHHANSLGVMTTDRDETESR